MKLIQELSEEIEEELDGAKNYVTMAIALKEEHPVLAKTFYDISTDEMRHVDLLHSEVVKLIEEHRKTKGEPPASMMLCTIIFTRNTSQKQTKSRSFKVNSEHKSDSFGGRFIISFIHMHHHIAKRYKN